ncbi:MAG: insulinase family protein [Saprospiraceae bacterium]|nr:insulinase family protein [Saprospiraceae bacterium]
MIPCEAHTLRNGLRVIAHQDPSTPIAAVNGLYRAGSRVEQPDRTGMAHLFEHLMFSGSAHVEDFDDAIQHAGGDSNAFTNADITNFYDLLPVDNLETALWLESDRMLGLRLGQEDVDVQKKVVIEEFKETCLDQPFGNLWHLMAGMVYQNHPYRWPTIGLVPEHVAGVTLKELHRHFHTWYRPNNAILSIAADMDPQKILRLAEKWFGDIPSGTVPPWPEAVDPPQTTRKEVTERQNVPVEAIYLGFLCPARHDPRFYTADLLTDILSNGPSSRLYRRLVMEKELFSHVDCYLTGSLDPGVLMIEGKPTPGISLEQAEAAIWSELEDIATHRPPDREVEKFLNKNEAAIAFSQVSVIHKAMNLGFFDLLGDPDLINQETALYRTVTAGDLRQLAADTFRPSAANVVYYRKE